VVGCGEIFAVRLFLLPAWTGHPLPLQSILHICCSRAYRSVTTPNTANNPTPSCYASREKTTTPSPRCALLNTIGKILESVVAKRISFLMEEHSLLPRTHTGGWKHTSVETAIQLLVEKTHAVWKKTGSWMATILSLDAEAAFDNVSHMRLIHNLRKRRIPTVIALWIKSFLGNHTT